MNIRSLLVVFTWLVVSQASAEQRWSLPANWRFSQVQSSEWFPAQVPGDVHADLFRNKRIPDPFMGMNEDSVAWVDTCDWEYQEVFDCPDSLLREEKLDLVFEGLDTYAEVKLNGVLLLEADNMFRTWTIPCKSIVKLRKNILTVRFHSALRRTRELAARAPRPLPGGDRVFARKAAYQFGWDFGPRFVGAGIWKPVYLRGWSGYRGIDVRVIQRSLTDNKASLDLVLSFEATLEQHVTVRTVVLNDEQEPAIQRFTLPPGSTQVTMDYTIRKPKRWWTSGWGEAFCYDLLVEVNDEHGNTWKKQVTIGLRTLELVQEKDDKGHSFYFKLNGLPLYIKGANMVPLDHFPARIDEAVEARVVHDACEAHMNMIRCWGGGVYPSDGFYEACDRKGILVWQDFMAACSMVPGDSAFVANFREEVQQQVVRLRNHPSLAIWCGNNEINEGWHNWGWQKEFKYTTADSAAVWKDYLASFETMIPEVIRQENPERTFWPSSPSIGWGRKESLLSGDCHYWGVWWGMEPFSRYEEKVGRFMSEYGFQSVPSVATFRDFTGTTVLDRSMPVIRKHDKHPTGLETIQTYLERSYRMPKDFHSYTYVSQLVQCDGMRTAIEAHRRNRPYCMGTLYWQLNDTWPGISWSSTDYYGRWKAMHHSLMELYGTMMITTTIQDRHVDVYVVSDSLYDDLARMELRVLDLKGNLRWSEVAAADIKANACSRVLSRDLSRYILPYDTDNVVLNIRIYRDNQVIAESNRYFCLPKNLRLRRPALTVRELPALDGFRRIEVKSSVLAKNVELSFNDDPSVFDRNYMDLLPGERYEFRITDSAFPADAAGKIKIYSLIDTY